MMDTPKSDWSATRFFEQLTQTNLLARREGFAFCRVSGLEGFEEALRDMQRASAFVCVSDISDGYTDLHNTPRTRRIKTVFLAMRHAAEDMDARLECMDIMRELFRQFMSRLILQKTRLEQNCIHIDPRITFNEVDRYFFSGCACAYFQIAVDEYPDLRFSPGDWFVRYDLWVTAYGSSRAKLASYVCDVLGVSMTEAREMADALPLKIVDNEVAESCELHEQHLQSLNIPYERKEHGSVPPRAPKVRRRL